MRKLKIHTHPSIESLDEKSLFTRLATRAISLHKNEILLLYTARYDDYSLPGGGLDETEDKIQGLIRELQEETGAKNVQNVKPFGVYEEYRPWYKPDFDIQHMLSYCYTCTTDYELGETTYEPYEITNGMKPVWVDIKSAIKHNEGVIRNSTKKGLSIERETFLLKLILKELV